MRLKVVPSNKPIPPFLIDPQLFAFFQHFRVNFKVLYTMAISNKLLFIPKILHILDLLYLNPLFFKFSDEFINLEYDCCWLSICSF